MSEQKTCSRCGVPIEASESHCPSCHEILDMVGSLDDLDAMERTQVQPGLVDDGSFFDGAGEDDELKTVRLEGFTSADLMQGDAQLGGSTDEVAYEQFMVQEDRTLVGGSEPMPSWEEGAPGAGSVFGGPPPVQPPGGYVLLEGADSPSMTVRHEAPSLGRDEALSTYSGPADIARGSASASPLKKVAGVGLVMLVLVGGFLGLKALLPEAKAPIAKKPIFVMLEIHTKPTGAFVWVNGKKLEQTTPTTVQARIDARVNLQIRKEGYKTIDFTWRARTNGERQFVLTALPKPKPQIDPRLLLARPTPIPRRRTHRRSQRRRRIPPNHAVLFLSTDPPGAKVRVQGRLQHGRTPMRVILPKGIEAKITVQKYGHHDAYFIWKVENNLRKKIHLYRHSWYNP